MSGPKSYSPPPSYSISAFNGKLNEIFQLQTKIKSLIDELVCFSCVDDTKGIQFDCSKFTENNKSYIANLIASFCIDHPGTFGQKVYDEFDCQIKGKLSQLKSFLEKINKEKKEFQNKKDDYEAFLAYESFYNHATNSFQSFKTQVIKYLENYLKEDFPDFFKEVENSIDKVDKHVEKDEFDFGFRNVNSSKKDEIKNDIEQCEAAINKIRGDISNKVLDMIGNEMTSVSTQLKSLKEKEQLPNDDIQALIDKINSYLLEVTDQNRYKKYKEKLEALMKSSSFQKDSYFYIELLEDIKEAEKIFTWKTEIQKSLAEINEIQIHNSLQIEKNNLIKFGISLIEKEKVKLYQIEDFQAQLKIFREKNERILLEESITQKEHQFLKNQLVKSLEALNYEVIDDMEVIDFERESDFIFKIPGQSNYLNLRFQDDGSFLYNFLILNKREELSIDQKQQKLIEMEITCKEFKKLLKDLENMGLKIDLKSEKPISEKILIQIPQKYQTKIKVSKIKKETIEKQKQKHLS